MDGLPGVPQQYAVPVGPCVCVNVLVATNILHQPVIPAGLRVGAL